VDVWRCSWYYTITLKFAGDSHFTRVLAWWYRKKVIALFIFSDLHYQSIELSLHYIYCIHCVNDKWRHLFCGDSPLGLSILTNDIKLLFVNVTS